MNTIQNPLRCILLWLILIVAMVLHFNYHVGEIFYGIDVVRPDANGEVPLGTHLIRTIYYHLPMVWMVVLLMSNSKPVKLGLFIISVVYSLSHAMHLVGESMNPDLSQITLLTLTLGISVLLSVEHYRYWKAHPTTEAEAASPKAEITV